MAEFRTGLYRHYKGDLYTALFVLTHHETGEKFVAYVSHNQASGVRLRELNTPGKDSWLDNVKVGDALVPRFSYVLGP
jgi:hypothetical protein